MRWAFATVAPWALSAGMLVSFTASAGQDVNPGATLIQRLDPHDTSELEQGPSLLAAASAFTMPGLNLSGSIRSASLILDPPDRYEPVRQPDLRPDLKSFANDFPRIDRDRKGDPFVSLRPTVSQALLRQEENWRARESWRDLATRELASLFAEPGPQAGAGSFSSDGPEPPRLPPVGFDLSGIAIEPAPEPEQQLYLDIDADSMERATPIIARSPELFWLENPETPESDPESAEDQAAEPDTAPEPDVTPVPKAPASRYAGLIAPQQAEREHRCLAEAIYFEARSESERGQAAVAQVVLNRAQSGIYPPTVCGVVYQNRHRHLACQFTFACEGKSLRITEPEPWRVAVQIARDVVSGKTYLTDVGASTHYHANYVRPYWAKRLRKMDVVGRHVFYKLYPGQT